MNTQPKRATQNREYDRSPAGDVVATVVIAPEG